MFAIHKITPAPWGNNYTHVESFETRKDAEKVLKVLESVNISFNTYTIVDWTEPKRTKKLVIAKITTSRVQTKRTNKSAAPRTRAVSTADPYSGVIKL